MEDVRSVSVDVSALEGIPFGVVGGEEISLARALHLLKIDFTDTARPSREWPRTVVEWVCLEQAAREAGLVPVLEEVQERMRQFRRERGLYAAADTERYLASWGCTVDEFGEAMELFWVRSALRQLHACEPAERHFAQHRTEYDSAVVSEIVVGDEGMARELQLQIREEGADFDRLAARYSLAASRSQGGFVGELKRQAMTAREAAALFAAETDSVVGPFPQQRQYRLLRVHEVRRAELTPEVRAAIEEQLWKEWLDRRIRASAPQILIVTHL